jgi:hypothetical protein
VRLPPAAAAGVEGAFRLGCERVLGALRLNLPTFCELLESLLHDPFVEWTPDAGAKEARRAFEAAVELRSFADARGDGSSAADELAAAAAAVEQALAAADAALAPFDELFAGAAATAAAADAAAATLAQCGATLAQCDADEAALEQEAGRGRAEASEAVAAVGAAAAEAAHCLQECAAWQRRHEAVLAALVGTPLPTEVAAPPRVWDPAAAEVPLGLVQPWSARAPCVVEAAMGMPPGAAPVSPSLLLQAAAADAAGQELAQQVRAACACRCRIMHFYIWLLNCA